MRCVRRWRGYRHLKSSLRESSPRCTRPLLATCSNVQPTLGDLPAEELNQIFQAIHASSRINPSTQKCRELVKSARKLLVALEGHSLSVTRKQSTASPTDELIVTSLNDICPSASLAYQQALIDFNRGDRMSWRGPATDLRESLREALDVLAPDSQILASPGFKLEGDAKRPTMKQKCPPRSQESRNTFWCHGNARVRRDVNRGSCRRTDAFCVHPFKRLNPHGNYSGGGQSFCLGPVGALAIGCGIPPSSIVQ